MPISKKIGHKVFMKNIFDLLCIELANIAVSRLERPANRDKNLEKFVIFSIVVI